MITLCLSYYNQKLMLAKQLEAIKDYPPEISVIVVDDGSPEPALSVISALQVQIPSLSLYRINDDVPWNRSEARNLGAYVARTEWIIQTDIDHMLPLECAQELVSILSTLSNKHWYKFPRWRVGKADHTRNKDALPREQEFGKIMPHLDSYLITREMYLASPLDERYSGCLGGGSPFIARLERLYGEPRMLGEGIALHVHTSSSVADASVKLDRDTSEYAKRREQIEKSGDDKPKQMLCHAWHKVI